MTTENTQTKAELLAQIANEYGQEQADALKKAKKAEIEAWIAEQEEDEGSKMANHIAKYRPGYVRSVSYTGRKSLSNGDPIAQLLEGKDPATVLAAAERLLGLEAGTLTAKYAHLNIGQRRMNAGNRIRAAIKRGDVSLEMAEQVLTH